MFRNLRRVRREGYAKHRLHRAAVNGAAAFLILSVIFVPLGPVFAQSANVEGAAASNLQANSNVPITSSVTKETPPPVSKATVIPEHPAGGKASSMPEEPLPQTAQQGPNPQPVANDTFDKDLVKVDENTGALNTSYPHRHHLQFCRSGDDARCRARLRRHQ